MMSKNQGFTIVEFMVAMTLGAVILAGVVAANVSQQRSYVTQDQTAEIQQNVRAALYYMQREIRMAGCNPTNEAPNTGIVAMGNDFLHIRMDITGGENDGVDNDGDGVVDEDTNGLDDNGDGLVDEGPEADEYRYSDGDTDDRDEDVAYSHYDSDGDGINDCLGRDIGAGNQPVSQNIDALNFVYLDEDGNVTATRNRVRAIQVTIVGRTERVAPDFADTTVYVNMQGDTVFDPLIDGIPDADQYRRKRVALEIHGRNLGLTHQGLSPP